MPIGYTAVAGTYDANEPVSQYTLDGEFIKNFSSAVEASETLHIPVKEIMFCCSKYVKTAGGYIWEFGNE